MKTKGGIDMGPVRNAKRNARNRKPHQVVHLSYQEYAGMVVYVEKKEKDWEVKNVFPLPAYIRAMCGWGNGACAVLNDGTIQVLSDSEIVTSYNMPVRHINSVAYDGENVWVIGGAHPQVIKIDIATGEYTTITKLSDSTPHMITYHDGYVWVFPDESIQKVPTVSYIVKINARTAQIDTIFNARVKSIYTLPNELYSVYLPNTSMMLDINTANNVVIKMKELKSRTQVVKDAHTNISAVQLHNMGLSMHIMGYVFPQNDANHAWLGCNHIGKVEMLVNQNNVYYLYHGLTSRYFNQHIKPEVFITNRTIDMTPAGVYQKHETITAYAKKRLSKTEAVTYIMQHQTEVTQ